MQQHPYSEEIDWLNSNPTFEALIEKYPSIWAKVGREIIDTANTGQSHRLNDSALKAKSDAMLWRNRIVKSRMNPNVTKQAISHIVKSRMLILTLDKGYLAAAAGRTSGKVRFSLWDGMIIQKLLFSKDFVRKPVSIKCFNFWWRVVLQKKLLMPMLQDKGIYCFYSSDLIAELGMLIARRSCVEIAAGDGTLSRFLNGAGYKTRATDDFSWNFAIDYPEAVENLKAKQALVKYNPKVVICSWAPPDNSFERQVFNSKSVELYIAIGSRHRFVSGNWEDYEKQKSFSWKIDEHLSSLVIPPSAGNAVLVFRRC